MRNWTTSEWLAFLAIIAAIIIGVAAILATRTWGNRRGKVLVAYSSTRLLAVKPAADELKVTFNDAPVNNPHLLSLVLKNIGSRDITREQFDGRSLSIELNCPLYGVVQIESSDGGPTYVDPDEDDHGMGFILIEPSHIPKGTSWGIDCIVSGPANPKVGGRLIEADIVMGETASSSVIKALALTVSEVGEVAVAAAVPFSGRLIADFFSSWKK
ncbi:hypothetical protein SAMN04489740_4135 [Arthrobacter alpinus]|uniref:Uncharacterized protein n=1 Tax=Arthrobacter alpinus TaxID=656366 RepID=A0A1H5PF86_9MICC|nr:hypothetical protein [Arthrobacter alpinus]SEF11721.1 hypothetical protein SAMN04489740_4135 [Arthrobacter alpinus]